MAQPRQGTCIKMKKLATYIKASKNISGEFVWQDECSESIVCNDSDWRGTSRDKKSTSEGAWISGKQRIQTWNSSQGAYAFSSAEA